MKLADDPSGVLEVEIIAQRAARLAKVAESLASEGLRYIIGTEVPIPGGATEHEEGVSVTRVEDVEQMIEVTKDAFLKAGLESAWDRVVGVVVQPGVEFGDGFVLPYRSEAAQALSKFLESRPMIYEAHSTDYQTREALKNLVRDHFAILKVGPGLTFAFREAVFALAAIENELTQKENRSNLMQVLEQAMLKHPEHWKKYYQGTEEELAFKRRYSLSDRVRYYWVQRDVQNALNRLMENLGTKILPLVLLKQFVGQANLTAAQVIALKIGRVLDDYWWAVSNIEE
jgi:D-tagatose-1,6-bisphosphate aldolase subunit GatZ/KbaZ